MKPKVRLAENLLEQCYDVPHRVHTSKVYPIRSPNGSSIIVCGHEQGLLVLWRGGRPFKRQSHAPDLRTEKAANKFGVMVFDSADGENVELYQNSPDFEDEEEEYDHSAPYSPIIQTWELQIGLEVLHISFPNFPLNLDHSVLRSLPSLISDKIVIALGCSDAKIRVLTLSLMPPPPDYKAVSKWQKKTMFEGTKIRSYGEQVIELAGHRSFPRGVCITITSSKVHIDEEAIPSDSQMNESDTKKGRRYLWPDPQDRSQSSSTESHKNWELLIASHSMDLSGVLLIHKVPIAENGDRIDTQDGHINPYQVHQLASSATCIAFNTPCYPSPQHSELVVTEAKGVIRVLDCLAEHASGSDGSWLVSFYSPFKNSSRLPNNRKYVISSQWCLNGKAIIVLYADGEWGIWDVGNAGTKTKNWLDTIQDPTAKGLTAFTSGGWIKSSIRFGNPEDASIGRGSNRIKLAPMTPGTRKVRQEALFTGPIAQSRERSRGGISIHPALDVFNDKAVDESILLWYEDTTVLLPSLLSCWQTRATGPGGIFAKEARRQIKQVNNPRLKGEVLSEVCVIPESASIRYGSPKAVSIEILFTGEHRIVIISSPKLASDSHDMTRLHVPTSTDQLLLDAGELDVSGMDRLLTNMSNGNQYLIE